MKKHNIKDIKTTILESSITRENIISLLESINEPIPETIDIGGKQRPTKNDKNRLIYPTMEGILNFWKWFVDSKIVDAQGRPRIFYHGTDADFSIFDRALSTKGSSKLGFWLTEDPAMADLFGSTLMPVYVKTLNPNKMDYDQWNALREKHGGEPIPFEILRNKLQSSGKDALIVEGRDVNIGKFMARDSELVAVFDGSQIKSASGNDGKFSNSNNIINENQEIKKEITGYHVTFASSLPSIKAQGLIVSNKKELGKYQYHLQDHSNKGIFFATCSDDLSYWISVLENYATDQSDDFLKDRKIPIVLKFSTNDYFIDDVATKEDHRQCSYYTTTNIPANKIQFYDNGWKNIDQIGSIDLRKGVDEDGYLLSDSPFNPKISSALNESIKTNKKLSLDEIYLDGIDDGEKLNEYISPKDTEIPFTVIQLDQNDLKNLMHGDQKVITLYKYANKEQKAIVKRYVEHPRELLQKPILISGTELLDGFHRVIAALKTKTNLNAIDISEEVEDNKENNQQNERVYNTEKIQKDSYVPKQTIKFGADGELLEGNGYSIRFIMEESAEFMENKLEDYLQKYTKQIADIAQKQYDDWDHLLSTDPDTAREEYAGGGICHLIADGIARLFNNDPMLDAKTISYDDEVHVATVVRLASDEHSDEFEMTTVDIPWRVYETGGGYQWEPITNVHIQLEDVTYFSQRTNRDNWDMI